MRVLAAAGADPLKSNRFGVTPLMAAACLDYYEGETAGPFSGVPESQRLDAVKLAVLDEADEMLDMGFREDIEFILQAVPATRQTVFFSATMPPQIKGLAEWALREPETAEAGIRFSPAETVSHYLYPVARDPREE